MFGAILSATDPVAVVALLRDVGKVIHITDININLIHQMHILVAILGFMTFHEACFSAYERCLQFESTISECKLAYLRRHSSSRAKIKVGGKMKNSGFTNETNLIVKHFKRFMRN